MLISQKDIQWKAKYPHSHHLFLLYIFSEKKKRFYASTCMCRNIYSEYTIICMFMCIYLKYMYNFNLCKWNHTVQTIVFIDFKILYIYGNFFLLSMYRPPSLFLTAWYFTVWRYWSILTGACWWIFRLLPYFIIINNAKDISVSWHIFLNMHVHKKISSHGTVGLKNVYI